MLKFSRIICILIITLINTTHQDEVVPTESNVIKEIADEVLKNQRNPGSIGGVIDNLINSPPSDLGDIVSNVLQNQDLLNNLGTILKNVGTTTGKNLDPTLLGTIFNLLNDKAKEKRGNLNDGFDLSSFIGAMTSVMSKPGTESLIDYFPSLLETLTSFMGPDADERAKTHAGHSTLLPPIVEKIHLYFDHFINSPMGQQMIDRLGAEKFVKIFSDADGKFNYDKFVEMLENHSFRKHWIQMVTGRIAHTLTYLSDPRIHKLYVDQIQFLVNSYLKSLGYPKSTFFNPTNPAESLTALSNQVAKRTLNMEIDSKQYVAPAVNYFQDLFRLTKQANYIYNSGLDSNELSNKLADTINLEIIEPIARVNRAFRFARKYPKCDKYVFCLVNQEPKNEKLSLPGLKTALSKSSSMIASWFITSYTDSTFWSLYTIINNRVDCQNYYINECHDFHMEEEKVTTEYVHNEL